MSIQVELLDATGAPIGAPRPLIEVAAPFLDRYLGTLWHGADNPILLLLPFQGEDNAIHPAPGAESAMAGVGNPAIRYGSEAIGYIQVRVACRGHALYRHPHTVAEVLGPGIRAWVHDLDGPAVTAYRIAGPTIERLAQVPAPRPQGVAEVTPYAAGESPAFRIRPIPPPEPPPRTLAELGAAPPDPDWAADPRHTDRVRVIMTPAVADALQRDRPFSDRVEEGGFLVGQVFTDAQGPQTHIALVTAAVPAEEVGASFLHFTFTGDSFDRIKQRLATEHQGQVLLGWYHTHLFPATDAIGLSSIDYRLHFTTFRIPWQVAGLVNLDGDERVLRYYVRQGDAMLQCHQQTARPDAPGQSPA